MLTIERRRDMRFYLLDDGLVYSSYVTREEAEKDRQALVRDEELAAYIDSMFASVAKVMAQIFGMSVEHAKSRIREQLR